MIGTAQQSQSLQLEKTNRKVKNLMPTAEPTRQAKIRRLQAMTTVYPENSAGTDTDTSGNATWLSTEGPWLENMRPGNRGYSYTGAPAYSQTKPGFTIPSTEMTRSTGEAGQPTDPFQTTYGLNDRMLDKMHADAQDALAAQKNQHKSAAKVRRMHAMTKLYPEKKPKTENVDLGSKGSFTVKKGALHEELGIPLGRKIPKAREEAAAHSNNPTLKRRAISALGFRAMK